jgi:hypothetical protein
MQGVWENALVNYTWNVPVGYLTDILKMVIFYRSCYQRLFPKKKKDEIVLSSGDEDDVMEVKPKLEEMERCCSSSLKD